MFFLDTLAVGGTELNAVRVAERLDRARFHISIASFGDGALRGRIESAGLAAHLYPIGSLAGVGMLREGARFVRFLRDEQVDIVHSHDRYSNLFAVLWARLAGTKGVIASKRWGQVLPVHAFTNRLAYRLSHRVLGNSDLVCRSLIAGDGVPDGRVVAIPNFVDEDAFDVLETGTLDRLRAQFRLPPDALVVGIVARLSPVKDHAVLIRAISAIRHDFPRLVLLIVGDGPTRPELEALVAAEGLSEMVRFAGMRESRPNLHRLFDISVLCSWSEGFPNSIVEAMAAARPVVATAVGGVPDAVHDGVNGRLVPARDVGQLAGALTVLLRDSALRQRMGAAGRDIASRAFSARTVLPSIAGLYAELARRSAR